MAEVQVPKINQEELIKKVEDLEKRLQTKDAEIQVYKMLISQMEEDASQAKKYKALHEKQTQDVEFLRTESEKTLTKAKSMIFEKTKVIKNQELQIEAFTQQIESLKEVVRITKDLLEIRNLEVQQLEIKISSMEGKQKAEKERYDLMHKKLEIMIRHNGELKREYETQLCLFTALRDRYNERELARGVIDNMRQNDCANDETLKNTDIKNAGAVVINNESETTINNANINNNIDISNQANLIPGQITIDMSDPTSNIANTINNEIENANKIASANKELNEGNVEPVTPLALEQLSIQNVPKNANSVCNVANNEIATKVEHVVENSTSKKEVTVEPSNEAVSGQIEIVSENAVQKTE